MAEIDWTAVERGSATLLSQYIQFDTSNPPGNEARALEFLADTLQTQGFSPQLLEAAPRRTNLIVRLKASVQVEAAPCLLYAHADVVPADAAGWSVPPFAGRIKEGFVWGRGALDSKGLGIVFLQALTLLKEAACPLNRDIILLIAADEERCGRYGVAWLLDHYPDLIRAEYVWDEGGAGFRPSFGRNRYLYQIAVAEKGALTVALTARGTAGHASVPHADNPQDRLVRALSRVKGWNHSPRLPNVVIKMLQSLANEQSFPRSLIFSRADNPFVRPYLRYILQKEPLFAPLIKNTVTLTMLQGGQARNVVPAQAKAKLDMRLLPGEDPHGVLAALRSLIADAKVSVVAEELPLSHEQTPVDTDFYRILAQTLEALGPPGLVLPYLTPGATDSRFFRRAGMKAYGFLPMLLDVRELSRIHGADERVSMANLRWGTQIVFETLRRLGQQKPAAPV